MPPNLLGGVSHQEGHPDIFALADMNALAIHVCPLALCPCMHKDAAQGAIALLGQVL